MKVWSAQTKQDTIKELLRKAMHGLYENMPKVTWKLSASVYAMGQVGFLLKIEM